MPRKEFLLTERPNGGGLACLTLVRGGKDVAKKKSTPKEKPKNFGGRPEKDGGVAKLVIYCSQETKDEFAALAKKCGMSNSALGNDLLTAGLKKFKRKGK